MIDLGATLSELARLRGGDEPIVSLYLDLHWRDEQQRERVRLFVQERARGILGHYGEGAPGRPELARTLAKVQDFVSGLTAQAFETGRNGLALFACESLGVWRPLFFARPFENELSADGVPHLVKLARLADDVAPALVVAPSREGADVYEVRLGDVDAETRVRGRVPRGDSERSNPGSGKPGRSSEREQKSERRAEELAQRSRRAAAAEVTALFDRRPGAKLVLVGTSEAVAAFERELPPRVTEHVVARVPRPREWGSGDGIRRDGVKAVAEAVLGHEREQERRIVDSVVGHALRGALAVLGPEDVVLAVNEGRVHELVIEADFRRSGWRCDNCDALGANAGSVEVCPFCAGDLRVVPELGEALVARTLAGGGRIEVVPHANKLHSYRGVAAFLRQTAPNGLSGASRPWPTAPGASQP